MKTFLIRRSWHWTSLITRKQPCRLLPISDELYLLKFFLEITFLQSITSKIALIATILLHKAVILRPLNINSEMFLINGWFNSCFWSFITYHHLHLVLDDLSFYLFSFKGVADYFLFIGLGFKEFVYLAFRGGDEFLVDDVVVGRGYLKLLDLLGRICTSFIIHSDDVVEAVL